APRPLPQGAGGWKNVTANVGGETWGYAGVTLLAGVPDRDEILAGVSEQGLWSSLDGGATWKKLGGDIKNRPHLILFDPKNPRTFWTSGCYGAGIWRTMDGGATFKRLGKLDHVDGIAVDFTDPARRTMLAGLHEQERSLQMSTDGGEKWEKIGDRLPEDSNFSTDPIILDSKTFLINTAGWRQGKTGGIYRSLDAGHTWSRVSDIGPSGRWLVSGSTIFWPALWGSGLVKGTEKGNAWAKLGGPAKSCPIALPGGRIVALTDQQLYLSKDEGASWEKLGDPLPIKAGGVTYSPKRKALYVWRSSDKKSTDAIFRWEMTE
ncbi:MAG TPA: hypothetical protein VEN81_05910, partial [Planctomycetota bacterium]|nr:hypothetical protein [Planctomycetota bacterium]